MFPNEFLQAVALMNELCNGRWHRFDFPVARGDDDDETVALAVLHKEPPRLLIVLLDESSAGSRQTVDMGSLPQREVTL